MEPIFLGIETSSTNCSVGLFNRTELIDIDEVNNGYVHGELLAIMTDKLLKKNRLSLAGISAIAIGEGPGSYTGLRIGVSFAKGLAFTEGLKLISVNSLHNMAMQVIAQPKAYSEQTTLVSVIDARRSEVFEGLYGNAGQSLGKIKSHIITNESYSDFKGDLLVFGSGAQKVKEICGNSSKLKVLSNIFPSVKGMQSIAHEKYTHQVFESVAYFEPFYLKEFLAGKPKKNLLLP